MTPTVLLVLLLVAWRIRITRMRRGRPPRRQLSDERFATRHRTERRAHRSWLLWGAALVVAGAAVLSTGVLVLVVAEEEGSALPVLVAAAPPSRPIPKREPVRPPPSVPAQSLPHTPEARVSLERSAATPPRVSFPSAVGTPGPRAAEQRTASPPSLAARLEAIPSLETAELCREATAPWEPLAERVAAAKALRDRRELYVAPLLARIVAAGDEHEALRAAAVEALAGHEGCGVDDVARVLAETTSELLRMSCAWCLGVRGDERSARTIESLCASEPSLRVRSYYRKALISIAQRTRYVPPTTIAGR